jgi:hypothetical protein
MLVGLHLEAHDPAAVDVDDDAVDHGDDFVAGQRVLPRLQRRVTHLRVHEDISPTLRDLLRNVAIFFESVTTADGRSLRVQPALSVAYPNPSRRRS